MSHILLSFSLIADVFSERYRERRGPWHRVVILETNADERFNGVFFFFESWRQAFLDTGAKPSSSFTHC